jgi:hypothetical protein
MKPSTKRFTSSIAALLFFVAAFVVFLELVQPAYSDLSSSKGKLAGEEAMLQNESSTIASVEKLIATYQSQATTQGTLAAALPVGENLAGAVAQIYGLAQANNISIQNTSVSVSAPKALAQSSAGANLLLRPTGTIAFAVMAAGNYESFLNFLSGLESNLRLFDVKQVSIQSASAAVKGQGQDYFNYLLTVDTYYQLP